MWREKRDLWLMLFTNDGWQDGTEDIIQEFYWSKLNYLSKLQNSNLENVTSSLQRINNAFEITIAPI